MSSRPRLSLSLRLCVSISFVVIAVMIAVSLPQQIARQREIREMTNDWLGSWGAYWLHVLVTTVVLSGSLYGVLRILIARPLERLLDGVRLMELGYWGEVGNTGGVWEIRWLAERFREMGFRLERTVENLAAAERRGGAHSAQSGELAIVPDAVHDTPVEAASHVDEGALREALETRLQELQELDCHTPEARVRAQHCWVRDPPLAEQLGEIDLKTRIEDAAFEILDPAGFADLERQLGGLVPDLLCQADLAENALRTALANDGVTVVQIQRRIKGLGSIWRKMESKGLLFSQIHDLLALRVVMQSTDDCYRALHLTHLEFSPIVGRFKDYIADPKPSGYQSIHTSVRLASGVVCEIQIRSLEMHRLAEVGDCAHWRYRLSSAGAAPHGTGYV